MSGEKTPPGAPASEVYPMPDALPPIDYRIVPETPEDDPAVQTLIADSFGPERQRRTVYQFRDGRPPIPDLAFVAKARMTEDGPDRLLASLNFWEVEAAGVALPLLGPLAVLADLRGRGVGRALVSHGLWETRAMGWPAVLIIGDPGYYAPFGFSVDLVAGLTMPGPVGPLTFMGLEFAPGSLSGKAGKVMPTPR
jgi:predicted N-acetyltransferase YhbS